MLKRGSMGCVIPSFRGVDTLKSPSKSGVKAHPFSFLLRVILRFWNKRMCTIDPMSRAGGLVTPSITTDYIHITGKESLDDKEVGQYHQRKITNNKTDVSLNIQISKITKSVAVTNPVTVWCLSSACFETATYWSWLLQIIMIVT